MLEALTKLGITPNNLSLYETARTHRSYLNEAPKGVTEHNERLEFLGDAVLELVMTDLIYHAYPQKEEGWMTDLRSGYVRGKHLAHIASEFGLDEILLLSQGERSAGGTKNPNILADMLEAIFGALYLDQGFEKAYEVIRQVVFMSEHVQDTDTKDPKSALQELVQKYLTITPVYEIVSESGKDHEKIFTIAVSVQGVTIGVGEGTNKKRAQESAAQNALEIQEKWSHLLSGSDL